MYSEDQIRSKYDHLQYSHCVELLDWMNYEWKMETSKVWASLFVEWEWERKWWTFFIVKVKDKKWHTAWMNHNPEKALKFAVWKLYNYWWIEQEKFESLILE